MSIDLSRTTEARLKAVAEGEGVSVDTCIQRMMNEREELAAILERATAPATALSREEMRAKIERGFLQSERGEVADGEVFCNALLAELDDPQHKRKVG